MTFQLPVPNPENQNFNTARELLHKEEIKGRLVEVFYDHHNDNYEVNIEGWQVWESNGENDPHLAGHVVGAVILSAYAMPAR